MSQSVDLIARTINRWNRDPFFTSLLRGKTIKAVAENDVLSVGWDTHEFKPFYTVAGMEAASVGWSDTLTDIIDILHNQRSN